MIGISLDPGGLHRAANELADRIDVGLRRGMEATLESIAARAKQTTTFVDRTGNLRNSIQSDGATGGGGSPIVGTVSFAATSEPGPGRRRGRRGGGSRGGYPYGLAQEFGTVTGVREKRFIRDAIDAENGDLIESALASVFIGTGFEVKRT